MRFARLNLKRQKKNAITVIWSLALKPLFNTKTTTKKLKLVKKACDGGNKLGCLTMSGIMMQKDPKKGIEYLEKRCDAGESTDCGLPRTMHSDASSQKRYIKSTIRHREACNLGEGLSCAMSAKRYVKGYGVKMGATKAAVYYKKGCDFVGEFWVAITSRFLIIMSKKTKIKPRSIIKKLAIPAKIVLSLIHRRNLKKLGKNPAICMRF